MNVETAKMSERGQIIIPKEVREAVGASTDAIFVFSAINKNTIVMRKLDTKSLVEEFRKLRSKVKKIPPRKIEEEIDA